MHNETCKFKILSSAEEGHPLTRNAKIGLISGLKEDAVEHYKEYLNLKKLSLSKSEIKVHEKIISDIENGYSEDVLAEVKSRDDIPKVVLSWASMDVCAKNCESD